MDSSHTGERAAAVRAPKRLSRSFSASKVYLAISRWSLYLVFLLIPLFFLPWNLEVLEVNKQTLLVILTFVGLLSWLGTMISDRSLSIKRGWLNLFPLAIILSVLVSTIFSLGSFISWIGQASQEYTSFLSFVSYVLLFYLVANIATEKQVQKHLVGALLLSSVIAGLIGLFSIFGMNFFPFDFAQSKTFNTVGTLNALAVYLSTMAIFASGLWLTSTQKRNYFYDDWRSVGEKICIFILSISAITLLTILDYWPLYVVLLSGLLILFAFSLVRAKDFRNTTMFVVPMALFVIALLLVFVRTPIRVAIPIEVTPSFSASWNIAKNTLGETSALFGSGPGTFVYDYSKYHTTEVNTTQLWNVKFDRGINHAMTSLATLGVLTALFCLLLVLFLAGKSITRVLKSSSDDWQLTFMLFPAWSALIVAAFVYSSNLTLCFLFFGLAGFLGAEVMRKTYDRNFSESPRLGLLFSFLFVLMSIGIVSVLFVTGQRYMAEIAFAQAVKLDRAGGDLQQIVEKLDDAAGLNRYNDIYYRNLSQALLLRVSEELGKIDKEQITSEQGEYIRALTAASINTAVQATELGPNNVLNWGIRGAIYREFVPLIGDAADFAVVAFQKAAELESANPIYPTEEGKTYLIIADNARVLTEAEDPNVKAEAEAKVASSLQSAEQALNRAIELKSDYAPAHYQLAIVYERQGRLNDSIGKMESVAQYNPLDIGVVFQLGLLYLRRGGEGDLDRAQGAFEHVVSLSPSYSNALWFLASIYEQKNFRDAAIQVVERVLELNPGNELVRSRLDRLKSGPLTDEIPPTVEEGEEGATSVPEGQPTEEPAAEGEAQPAAEGAEAAPVPAPTP